MYMNVVSQNASTALPELLDMLLTVGQEVDSRAGKTKELTHVGITLLHPEQREIIVPFRNPSIAAQIAETVWVLSGRDDIQWLSNYLPRVYDFSDDGETWRAGYGKRIRHWSGENRVYDQLAHVVAELQKTPLTRQAVISIWDPSIDTEPGKDIPCNDWISFIQRNGQLDMHVALRSNDAIWGWSGINAFEWSAMLEIVAYLVGSSVGSLHFSTTSFHLYEHHWDRAKKIVDDWKDAPADGEAIPAWSPRFFPKERSLKHVDDLFRRWFQIEEQIRTRSIPQVDIARAVEAFPEPMLKSWLRVIQWWWTGQRGWLTGLAESRLELATVYSVQPKVAEYKTETLGDVMSGVIAAGRRKAPFSEAVEKMPSAFIQTATELHSEKHAAYGDSWKRRGEMLGIMANIARKIDRLGKSDTSDETSADTAMDLMVYLAKYRTWLTDFGWGSVPSRVKFLYSDDPKWANELLFKVEKNWGSLENLNLEEPGLQEFLEEDLTRTFESLENLVTNDSPRYAVVDSMLRSAYHLARLLWEKEEETRRISSETGTTLSDAATVGGGIPGSWTDEYQGADHD